MAEALIFHYRERNNLLVKTHPLIKLIALILICIPLVSASLYSSIFLIGIILFTMVLIKLPLNKYLRELSFFIILSIIIGISNYLSTNSVELTTIAVLKFATAVLASLILADTTDPSDLARAIGSALNHIPFVNGWIIASQIELTLSCIPLIFDTTQSIKEARTARLENSLKHPIKSFFNLVFLMMDTLIYKIDEMAYALDSRDFDPKKERNTIKFKFKDLVILLLACAIGIGGFLL